MLSAPSWTEHNPIIGKHPLISAEIVGLEKPRRLGEGWCGEEHIAVSKELVLEYFKLTSPNLVKTCCREL
jgi:hypothetical protein